MCQCNFDNIPLTATDFKAKYSEFNCLTDTKATQYIQYSCIQFCGFEGMCGNERLIAFELATAHLAFMFHTFTENPKMYAIKSIKNRDEQITYKDNQWDLNKSPYGEILDGMLSRCSALSVIEPLSSADFQPCNRC